MNVSPNILAKNWNFKNLRNSFVDEKALIPPILMSSCHWKTLIHFCLWKKRPENAFLTLIVNYRKIVQKNKLRLKTTINWLFNDIMLFIHCLFWLKNWRFSWVYYILKRLRCKKTTLPIIKSTLTLLISLLFFLGVHCWRCKEVWFNPFQSHFVESKREKNLTW